MLNKIKGLFKVAKSDKHQNKYMKTEHESSFEIRMKKLESYFKLQSEKNDAFRAEFEAANRINKLALKDEISKEDLEKIVSIFNDTNSKPHYNGTAWFDFALHIQFFLKSNGLNCQILPNKNLPLINPK